MHKQSVSSALDQFESSERFCAPENDFFPLKFIQLIFLVNFASSFQMILQLFFLKLHLSSLKSVTWVTTRVVGIFAVEIQNEILRRDSKRDYTQ